MPGPRCTHPVQAGDAASNQFRPLEAWLALWALVKLGHVDNELLFYAAQHVMRHISTFPLDELSRVLWVLSLTR